MKLTEATGWAAWVGKSTIWCLGLGRLKGWTQGTLAAMYLWGLSSTAVSGEVDFLGDGSGPRARLPKDWKCQSLKVWVWTLHGTISAIFYGSSSDNVHPDSREGGIGGLSRG